MSGSPQSHRTLAAKIAELGWVKTRKVSDEMIGYRDAVLDDPAVLEALAGDGARRSAFAFLSSVTFAREGIAAYDAKIGPVRGRHPTDIWIDSHLDVLSAAARFGDLVDLTRRRHREDPGDLWRLSRHVSALLAAGQVGEAAEVSRDRVARLVRQDRRKALQSANMQVPIRLLSTVDGYFPMIDAHPDHGGILARRVARAQPTREELAPRQPNLPVFVLNLDRDLHRLDRLRGTLGADLPITRIPGVPGAAIPRVLLRRAGIWRKRPLAPSIGCHLSHVHAWERTANACADDEYALILEDDSQFIFGPGAGLDQAIAAARGEDLEILFVSDRVSGRGISPNRRVTRIDALFRHADRGMPLPPATGGDAYLLSGSGARKLNEIFFAFGIAMALDFLLVMSGVEDFSVVPDIPEYTNAGQRLQAVRADRPNLPRLRAGAYRIPLTRSVTYGFTAHDAEKHAAAGL